MRRAFDDAIAHLHEGQRVTVHDMPVPLCAATRRVVAELRRSRTTPEEMLRRIKPLIEHPVPRHGRDCDRQLAAAVVSYAIEAYFER